ncbi:MAG: type II secretion system protein [Richelia sp.]|nr:type II secretion system protein [Richelia sp.]CDN11614.1 COG2165: Type II secretory pathway, pseudopilin PulG [Richelia intracellularis]
MNRNTWAKLLNSSDNGFTLLEILVVIFMVSVLAANAAPSWLAFVKNQQLNKANELVFAALQEAQREAKKDKRNYSVSFRLNNGVYEYSVDSGTNSWKNFTQELGIPSGEIIVGTNLNTANTVTNPATVVFNNLNTTKTVTFDQMGALALNNPSTVIKIVVAIPQSTNSTTPSNNKRCAIVESLLGGMRSAKDDECN